MNQQRYIEIEEEKLAIMRENLEIEKRKLELLEQYVSVRRLLGLIKTRRPFSFVYVHVNQFKSAPDCS